MYSPPMPRRRFRCGGGSLPVEKAIVESTYPVAPEALERAAWGFGRPETNDLIARLQAAYVPLGILRRADLHGCQVGLTEAFVIDATPATRF